MYSFVQSEWLKSKRTLARYIFYIVPGLLLLFTLVGINNTQNPSGMYTGGIPVIQISFFNLWPMILSPILITLGCFFNLKLDKTSHFNQLCLANDWDLKKNLVAKIIIISGYYLISTLLFILISLVSIYLTTKSLPNYSLIISTTCLIYIAQLCLIPFNLILLRYLNVIVVLILNFCLSFVSALTILTPWYWLIPHGYALKVVTIMMGIHPNGVPFELNSLKYKLFVHDWRALTIIIIGSLLLTIVGYLLNILCLRLRKN